MRRSASRGCGMMAGNAMVFRRKTKEGSESTLRVEPQGSELAVVMRFAEGTALTGLTIEEEDALMRLLIDRCNARPRILA